MSALSDIVQKFRKSSPNIATAFDEVERRLVALETPDPAPQPLPLYPRPAGTFEEIVVRAPGTYPANPVAGRNYRFTIDVTSTSGGRVVLQGGRHRLVVGARIDITGGNDPIALLIEGGDTGGITHIEGCYLRSVNGVTVRTNQTVQLVNNHVRVAGAAEHADVIQAWAGAKCPGIRVDGLTAHSEFTFLSDLTDEPGVVHGTYTPGSWDLHNVDLHGPNALNNWMGSPQHAVWRGDNLWLETSTDSTGQRRDLGDQLRQHGEQYVPKHAGYQILDAADRILYTQSENVASGAPGETGRTAGHWLRYHLNPRLTMTWRWGVPPGGEFVPAWTTGPNYR